MSDPRIEEIIRRWKEFEEESQEFAERANDAAQKAARARQEAAKWPEFSEMRERHEKEAQRQDELAERYSGCSENAAESSAGLRTLKISLQTGFLTFLPESMREEGALVSFLSRYTEICSGGVEIHCRRCRKRDQFDAPLGRPLMDVALQEKAAAHFFKAGWRVFPKVLCPECSDSGTVPEKPPHS